MIDRWFLERVTKEEFESGMIEKLIRLIRKEESRQRQLLKRDRFNRVLDKIWTILVFPSEVIWSIILMPITLLIREIRYRNKGGR